MRLLAWKELGMQMTFKFSFFTLWDHFRNSSASVYVSELISRRRTQLWNHCKDFRGVHSCFWKEEDLPTPTTISFFTNSSTAAYPANFLAFSTSSSLISF